MNYYNAPKTSKLHVPAPEDMARRLDKLARQARISKAEAARRAIEKGLPLLEREITRQRQTYHRLTEEAGK